MKNLIALTGAGIIGGICSYVLMMWVSPKPISIHPPNTSPSAQMVSTHARGNTSPAGDFVLASEMATEVVVHIIASESEVMARQRMEEEQRRYRSPFDDFFGRDFFGRDFFGQDFSRRNFYQPRNGSGSGVIISPDGYIVTNNHVVGFADEILVTLSDGREVNARKIGTDPTTDLAVIKIDIDGSLPTLQYADSDEVQVGEWVLAVGNPFRTLTSTVTAGIVSAKGRDLDIIEGDRSIEEFIQTDAAINPGNSGGALVNTSGQLIGINTAIATPTGVYAGYSFAIPANLVQRITNDIIEYGDIERVNLGVLGYDVDTSLREELELSIDRGFYIESVDRGSAAQYAGLLPSDIIIAVDDREVISYDDIADAMKYSKAGDLIPLEVLRKGKKKEIKVKLRKGL